MNILVIGGGLLGRRVAEMLDAAGHDVAVIDESEDNIAQLDADFGGVTSVGFPMDLKNLRSAGIESCDAVAVTTSDDNLNITVGQIAKTISRSPRWWPGFLILTGKIFSRALGFKPYVPPIWLGKS